MLNDTVPLQYTLENVAAPSGLAQPETERCQAVSVSYNSDGSIVLVIDGFVTLSGPKLHQH